MEVEIAVRKFDVPHTFSDKAQALADRLPDSVRLADVKGRIDLRDLPFMTIDGEDARDFDDAVYAEPIVVRKKPAGFRLLVAIADVSHYVKNGDALDRDAFERATSVYFPRRVLPMLPEKLSNGLCSLNPGVERLALVCDMVVSAEGTVDAYQFYEGVILSSERLTYDRAWSAIADPDGPEARHLGPRHATLMHLYAVYQTLLAQRVQRGAIDLETVETYMQVGADGRIAQILPRVRNDAHRLIEECMLAANTSAADFLHRSSHPGLFRVHEGPTPERLKSLREFLRMQGLRLEGQDDPQPADYARLAKEIKARPDARLLQTLLLRSMQQAIYSPDNVGHFGLAYEAYAHFTSPIRRYPDLLVHRVIKAVLARKSYLPAFGAEGLDAQADVLDRWRRVGDHCSAAERRADDASRDVEAWLKCQFMKGHVGEEFRGVVTGVTSFGLFVTLESLYVEGLIHVSELGAEYFQHNEIAHELRGERTGRRFRLYDSVSILVSRVDLDARRIEFRLVPSMVRTTRRPKAGHAEDDVLADVGPDLDWHDPADSDSQAPSEPAQRLRGRGAKPKGSLAPVLANPKSVKKKKSTFSGKSKQGGASAEAAGAGSRKTRTKSAAKSRASSSKARRRG
jgi:ribonuclease R